jgi:hypothetical protein
MFLFGVLARCLDICWILWLLNSGFESSLVFFCFYFGSANLLIPHFVGVVEFDIIVNLSQHGISMFCDGFECMIVYMFLWICFLLVLHHYGVLQWGVYVALPVWHWVVNGGLSAWMVCLLYESVSGLHGIFLTVSVLVRSYLRTFLAQHL